MANMTNLTGIDSKETLWDLSGQDDDEPVYVGFIESSLARIIPKFLKAMATLGICGFLLGFTFLSITLWKRGCRTHKKLHEEDPKENNGSVESRPFHSVVVTPPEDDESLKDFERPSSSSLQPVKHMNVPKQQLRRASGPFGSDALTFVGEQYKMKSMEKEKHYHSPLVHHHRSHWSQDPHAVGGGSSSGRHTPTPVPSAPAATEEAKGKKCSIL